MIKFIKTKYYKMKGYFFIKFSRKTEDFIYEDD